MKNFIFPNKHPAIIELGMDSESHYTDLLYYAYHSYFNLSMYGYEGESIQYNITKEKYYSLANISLGKRTYNDLKTL